MMGDLKMKRMTGIFALASVVLWLAIFPLYMAGDPSVSLYDGDAIVRDFVRMQKIVLTRVLLGLALYVTLMIFAVGFREVIRKSNAAYEWVGTLAVMTMSVWVGVTLVANGLEGGIALDTLNSNGDPSVARALTMGYLLIYNGSIAFVMTGFFLAVAGYATFTTHILPQWTGWIAYAGTLLCVISIPAMYVGRADPSGFYNAGGWGAAIIANFPPLLWFLVAGLLLVRKQGAVGTKKVSV